MYPSTKIRAVLLASAITVTCGVVLATKGSQWFIRSNTHQLPRKPNRKEQKPQHDDDKSIEATEVPQNPTTFLPQHLGKGNATGLSQALAEFPPFTKGISVNLETSLKARSEQAAHYTVPSSHGTISRAEPISNEHSPLVTITPPQTGASPVDKTSKSELPPLSPPGRTTEDVQAIPPLLDNRDSNRTVLNPQAPPFQPGRSSQSPEASAFEVNGVQAIPPPLENRDSKRTMLNPRALPFQPGKSSLNLEAPEFRPNDNQAIPLSLGHIDPKSPVANPLAVPFEPGNRSLKPEAFPFQPAPLFEQYDVHAIPSQLGYHEPERAVVIPTSIAFQPGSSSLNPEAPQFEPSRRYLGQQGRNMDIGTSSRTS